MTGIDQASPKNLPTGTLTFLFTDVEGSTRLWEFYPEQMRQAMVHHDQMIESIAAQNQGVVVRPRGEGDSRFIVFNSASNAIITAVAIQVQFSVDAWVASSPMRVRMALHTGEADLRDGDYYGSAVNRCARLRNVAYGGQILLSQTTYSLVRETLPAGITLRDLGEHQLKDLRLPEHIYQLTSQGLIPEFPAIKTTGRPVAIRSPDHRLHVYLSMASDEMAEECQAARQAIINLHLTPVMIEFSIRSHPARQLYQEYLAQSHIYIAVFGQGYGWILPGMQLSILEDEYNLAASLPVLIYVKDSVDNRDLRLIRMLERINIENAGFVKSFTTPEMLGELIENDLMLILSEHFETVRGLETAPEETAHQPITNVPIPRNPLIGRERELAAARNLLLREEAALVTLTGPGGAGKSRLGIQIALDLRNFFADGVYLVELESIREPDLVIPTIAKTLGISESPKGPPLAESLKSYLCNKQVLLLLDNFEQVLAAGPQIAHLLEACPRVKMIVTSRAPLRLRSERELLVPPLATPSPKRDTELQRLTQYSAVQLFIQRAQGNNPDFSVTNENAPAIAEICHRLDGLPLAIELASARIKMLSPQALLARLEHRFEILRGGTVDLPERQHTLYSAIDWSYNLLSETEKRLFRQLAVFVGGWTNEAAEVVCSAPGEASIEVFDNLERLVEHNLLKLPVEIESAPRFYMLESIREFAMKRLLESGDIEAVRHRHAQFYLTLADQAYPELISSRQTQWLSRLEIEHDNIRSVLEWSQHDNIDLGLHLCAAIWRFWVIRCNFSEGRTWLETFISLAPAPIEARSRVLHAAAVFAVYQGDYQAGQVHLDESLSISELQGNKRGMATGLNELGLIAVYQGDYPVARQLLEKSLVIKRQLGDEWLIANSYVNLGLVSSYQNDYISAYTLHQESLNIFRALGETSGIAIAYSNLGHVSLRLGRLDEARAMQSESLLLFNKVGDIDGVTECLERLAMVANATEDPSRAARLFGAASVSRIEAGTSLPQFEKAEYDRELLMTRQTLESETFNKAWAEGQAMTLAQAIAYARG